MTRSSLRRRDAPKVEVGAAGFCRAGDRRPPCEVVAHQLPPATAAPGEEAVGASPVSGHENSREGLPVVRRERGIRAAPRKYIEQKLVVTPVRQVNRYASLDGRRLTRKLSGILALLDDDSALDAGADVVTTTMAKRRNQLARRHQLEDPRVLWLCGCNARESLLGQDLSEALWCFRFDDDARHPGGP